jgi:four helix bundle protein
MQIVLKELRETDYWLRLLDASELAPHPRLSDILQESDELISIVVKSLVTARGNAHDAK